MHEALLGMFPNCLRSNNGGEQHQFRPKEMSIEPVGSENRGCCGNVLHAFYYVLQFLDHILMLLSPTKKSDFIVTMY